MENKMKQLALITAALFAIATPALAHTPAKNVMAHAPAKHVMKHHVVHVKHHYMARHYAAPAPRVVYMPVVTPVAGGVIGGTGQVVGGVIGGAGEVAGGVLQGTGTVVRGIFGGAQTLAGGIFNGAGELVQGVGQTVFGTVYYATHPQHYCVNRDTGELFPCYY
jgi:hypothetical protein